MESNPNRPGPQWLTAFDEMAAFSARVFAKVGQRPHAYNNEGINWTTFNCAECIEWQKRFDAAFHEELAKLKNQ